MGIIASVLLAFVGEGDYILASILLIIGTVGYSGGNVFYDGFLPEITERESMDKVSAAGFAWGYIGGGILLAINILMIMKYDWFGLKDETVASQVSFASVGIWWLIFAIPLLKNVYEEKRRDRKEPSPILISGSAA